MKNAVLLILGAMFVAGFVIGVVIGHDSHPTVKQVTCTFDGGGTIGVGEMTHTSDGNLWACTNGGVLVEVTYP
jgi:hypothetical protein